MRKIINSSTAKYEDQLTDNLVLDDQATLNSFNGITSDAVARAIVGAGNVPAPGAGDDGKVLTVVSGMAAWAPSQGGGGGASYTAGPAIQIESDTIDVRLNTNSGLLKSVQTEMAPMGGPSEKEPLCWVFPFGSSSMLNSVELPEISKLLNVPADYDLDGAVNLILVYADEYGLHPEDDGYAVSVYTGHISFNGEWGMWELQGGQIIPVNADSEHWTFHDNFTFASWDEWGNPPAALLTLKGTVGGDAPNGEIIIAGTSETGVPCYPMAPGLKVEYPLPASGDDDENKVLTVVGGVAAWWPMPESPFPYVECHKLWSWGNGATYTSNDLTIEPDFYNGESWQNPIEFQGYAHCTECQINGKFEGDGTCAATNGASTNVTLVFAESNDPTTTFTIQLSAKQFVRNFIHDPEGSAAPRYNIGIVTEEFRVPGDTRANKGDTTLYLKSAHIEFAGLQSGGTALSPDDTAIAVRMTTFPYYE